MWKDSSGYLYSIKIPGSTLVETPDYKKITIKRGSRAFLNEGGTIVALPCGVSGVNPVMNLPMVDPWFNMVLEKENISYIDGIVKLSEKWGVEDYFQFKSHLEILSKEHKEFIITYGTDCISFFAPWVALLCKDLNVKAVIIVGQRSWDRPTSQFPLLLKDSFTIFSKLPPGGSVVLTHNGKNTLVHLPYQIKKFHTTSKKGFYSRNCISLSKLTFVKKLKFKKEIHCKSTLEEVSPISVSFETPLTNMSSPDLLVSRGVGNSRFPPVGLHSTIVCSGPTCEYLYSGCSTSQLFTSIIDPSWQSLYIIGALTDYENRS